jgi:predicted metal-binding protein
MDLYIASKDEYKNYNDLNSELCFIYTQTFIKNNNLYLHCRNINDLLSNYRTAYIVDLKTGAQNEKRIFNKNYKTQYRDAMQKLEELIKSKGGVL